MLNEETLRLGHRKNHLAWLAQAAASRDALVGHGCFFRRSSLVTKTKKNEVKTFLLHQWLNFICFLVGSPTKNDLKPKSLIFFTRETD